MSLREALYSDYGGDVAGILARIKEAGFADGEIARLKDILSGFKTDFAKIDAARYRIEQGDETAE